MKMSELVENVSKKPIAPWTKNLLVEVMVNDENDEDVEVSQLTGPSQLIRSKLMYNRFHTVSFTSRLEGRGSDV